MAGYACHAALVLSSDVAHLQIVKHFNSTEQGIKNYLHRHVRARKLHCT